MSSPTPVALAVGGDTRESPTRTQMSESDSPTTVSVDEKEKGGEHSLDDIKRNGSVEVGVDHEQQEGAEDEELSDDSEDEEEEDDDDDEEEEEPTLKYQRITGAIPDLLKKDSASALAVSNNRMALGTHAGIIHILDLSGKRIKSYKPHMASIVDISMDATADFVATASMDGQVVVHSLSTPETYSFDMKRPMRTVAMEPDFAKRSSRAFVCGGLSGALVLREKGWLGHKETTLHQGEGPVWTVRWRGKLIAWANDNGIKMYSQTTQSLIAHIDRPPDSPRAEVFRCTLHFQDDSTLLIGWADLIKVARVRVRANEAQAGNTGGPPLFVEITAVFKLDCMVAGIVPHPVPVVPSTFDGLPFPETLSQDGQPRLSQHHSKPHQHHPHSKAHSKPHQQTLTSLLILSYTPPETFDDTDIVSDDRTHQKRKPAERPELRIISRKGEELSADALSVSGYERWGCNDYSIAEVGSLNDLGVGGGGERSYVVLSPRDLVRVMKRDKRDRVQWLVERGRYEEAMGVAEEIEAEDGTVHLKAQTQKGEGVGEEDERHLSAQEIGQMFVEHLVGQGDFSKAAQLCPKVCAQDSKRWESWIFRFAQQRQLQMIIPYVPTNQPRLDHLVYEMMLAHFLSHDRQALLQTIKEWPREIYDIGAVIVAVKAELDKSASSSYLSSPTSNIPKANATLNDDTRLLMESLAELYTINRQPGKALPFYMRLGRPDVFELIREYNLFTDVKDMVGELVEFEEALENAKAKAETSEGTEGKERTRVEEGEVQSDAIKLLVDNIHSIPITRVVQQLHQRPYHLFLYLSSITKLDAHLTSAFADLLVKLYAQFSPAQLLHFLRTSSSYDLELAYSVCEQRDLVGEQVFLLGRMGNNKAALNLIIERLGDVKRAIEFAKEQGDSELWEDLLSYAETRPNVIRGLLESVGTEISISPVRLIRRVRDGLEIEGLKEAVIKILGDYKLQIGLMQGCGEILGGDIGVLSGRLRDAQEGGFLLSGATQCEICTHPLGDTPEHALAVVYLCRHVVHASCVPGSERVALPLPDLVGGAGFGGGGRGISSSIAFESMFRTRVGRGCPVCAKSTTTKEDKAPFMWKVARTHMRAMSSFSQSSKRSGGGGGVS